MNQNLSTIIAIEILIATQGIELRAPITTSPALIRIMQTLRAEVMPLEDDRYMADDIINTSVMVMNRAFIDALENETLLPVLATA